MRGFLSYRLATNARWRSELSNWVWNRRRSSSWDHPTPSTLLLGSRRGRKAEKPTPILKPVCVLMAMFSVIDRVITYCFIILGARVDYSRLFFPTDQFISGDWAVKSGQWVVPTKPQPDPNPKPPTADQRTDQRANGPTSYRDARTHLKTINAAGSEPSS